MESFVRYSNLSITPKEFQELVKMQVGVDEESLYMSSASVGRKVLNLAKRNGVWIEIIFSDGKMVQSIDQHKIK